MTHELGEEVIPETFDLRPLSRRRRLAKVIRRGPASFRFISDEDELEAED